jgi:hypothetical protein
MPARNYLPGWEMFRIREPVDRGLAAHESPSEWWLLPCTR